MYRDHPENCEFSRDHQLLAKHLTDQLGLDASVLRIVFKLNYNRPILIKSTISIKKSEK